MQLVLLFLGNQHPCTRYSYAPGNMRKDETTPKSPRGARTAGPVGTPVRSPCPGRSATVNNFFVIGNPTDEAMAFAHSLAAVAGGGGGAHDDESWICNESGSNEEGTWVQEYSEDDTVSTCSCMPMQLTLMQEVPGEMLPHPESHCCLALPAVTLHDETTQNQHGPAAPHAPHVPQAPCVQRGHICQLPRPLEPLQSCSGSRAIGSLMVWLPSEADVAQRQAVIWILLEPPCRHGDVVARWWASLPAR